MRVNKKSILLSACILFSIGLLGALLLSYMGNTLFRTVHYRLTSFKEEDYAIFEEEFEMPFDHCRAVELITEEQTRDACAYLFFLMDAEAEQAFLEAISSDYKEPTSDTREGPVVCLDSTWGHYTKYRSQTKMFTQLDRYEEKDGRILWRLQYRYAGKRIDEMARTRGEKITE